MRKVSTMSMTSVAVTVMRMTVLTRPGYGATSHRMNSRNQSQDTVRRVGWSRNGVAWVAISRLVFVSADHDDCRFSKTHAIRGRRLDPDADGVAAGQVYPAQSALHVGQAGRDSAQDRRIGDHTVAGALDHASKSPARVRHDIHVRDHARLNMFQLRFTEIGKHPPDASVDEREDLLPDVSISTLRNDEIGYARVEWSVDAALVVVVLGVGDCGSASPALVDERIEGKYAGLGLVELGRTLLCRRLGLSERGQHGIEMGSIESQLRFGFVDRLRAGPFCCTRLVDLVDGNVLFDEEWLDAVQVVFCVCPTQSWPDSSAASEWATSASASRTEACARSTLALALRVAASDAVTACTSA